MPESKYLLSDGLINAWKPLSKPGHGWAFYRLSGATDVNFSGGPVIESAFDALAGPCFAIAPFYQAENKLWCIENELQARLGDADFSAMGSALRFHYSNSNMEHGSTKEDYIQLVENVISEIENDRLKKAVPARVKHLQLARDFSPFLLFRSLLDSYPNAFVYLLSTPQTGTWMGCTPEKLLQAEDNMIHTMSLAATKKTENAGNENFSPKETDEQDIVTQYIYGILKRFCSGVKLDGPRTIRAGNVSHLATWFEGALKQEYRGKYMQLIKALHPTPAVCGMPLQASRGFLLNNEHFDRSLYSGFLGAVSETSADIYVNLRCMQVLEHSALLYAGAGVVAGSNPEQEWLETEEKMKTLLRFL